LRPCNKATSFLARGNRPRAERHDQAVARRRLAGEFSAGQHAVEIRNRHAWIALKHRQSRAHQVKFQAVGYLSERDALNAALHVRNPLESKRMRA
jgi:hypothetical protein